MATPSEKLVQSLEKLQALLKTDKTVIRSGQLSRIHQKRLCDNGFLQEVIKGWYIPTRPDETEGDSTAWFTSFWSFCAAYLTERFGSEWCLSPEHSLSLWVGNRTVPRQLVVRSEKARSNPLYLPYQTSILEVRAHIPSEDNRIYQQGLYRYTLPAALIACSSGFFRYQSTDARLALSMVYDASEILRILLDKGHSTIAGRLAGAFRNNGQAFIADDILRTMKSAGYDVREHDPFETATRIVIPLYNSPQAKRIPLLWDTMRSTILEHFPPAPGLPKDGSSYLQHIDDTYVNDAYHSLSIEGYHVNRELIERVRSGVWNPDNHPSDSDARSALAARGYWLAYQAVKKSTKIILAGENPGSVVESDHRMWYLELFSPSVLAGILKPADLAGYRNDQVYIRRSMHVPPPKENVSELMSVLIDCLKTEPEASVRAILGHFFFVYIHPYMDGNGRIGRFLFNTMLASGGYPWTIVPVEKRKIYIDALEEASVNENILPFTKFISALLSFN